MTKFSARRIQKTWYYTKGKNYTVKSCVKGNCLTEIFKSELKSPLKAIHEGHAGK